MSTFWHQLLFRLPPSHKHDYLSFREKCYIHIIASSIDISMFNVKYLAMHTVQVHAGAIRKVLYGLCFYTGDNPLAKARGLSSCTDAQTIQ